MVPEKIIAGYNCKQILFVTSKRYFFVLMWLDPLLYNIISTHNSLLKKHQIIRYSLSLKKPKLRRGRRRSCQACGSSRTE
ncbi:hypothetical protein AtEden1_Chr5g0108691 [Arabidopsis thaliana]